jgi:hypothetical protein
VSRLGSCERHGFSGAGAGLPRPGLQTAEYRYGQYPAGARRLDAYFEDSGSLSKEKPAWEAVRPVVETSLCAEIKISKVPLKFLDISKRVKYTIPYGQHGICALVFTAVIWRTFFGNCCRL